MKQKKLDLKIIISIKELPSWAHRYEFIYDGYRNPLTHSTAEEVLNSLFTWNTETLNVHLHIWPAIACVSCMVYVMLGEPFAIASGMTRMAMVLPYIGCGALMFFSVFAHTTHVMSSDSNLHAWRIDMFGIIAASFCRSIAEGWLLFGLILNSTAAFTVGTLLSIILAALTTWRTMYDEYDWTMVYAAISITPLCAIYTAIAYSGTNTNLQGFANYGMLSTLFLYVASSAFYKGKLPERYVRLDVLNYIGNSHQIFHVLSALGFYMGFGATGYFPAIERSLSMG